MATESKYKELLSKVHQGVPLEKPEQKIVKEEVEKPADVIVDTPIVTETETKIVEPVLEVLEAEIAETASTKTPIEPLAKVSEKRKRKPQVDYQSLFFNRIDFTHRKPLYITATTHRRLMRIVHLMDESKATISSYVENIILNHLETFKEDIDTIYQTNNINPTE
ncbi:DUF3408 domain-containing protein [Porphyromonas pogonae]|uniref:DUF3408 domain-containing protein n=1 Tax=Porphyromonas pogonae TaxID=867595 RepID=UPI002E79CB5E|nr:DUF3408 domain-containing protein [Porphyromonas pogonae]